MCISSWSVSSRPFSPPSGAWVSSHSVPYPSWPTLKPGTAPRTPLLRQASSGGCSFLLPVALSQGWKTKVNCSPSSSVPLAPEASSASQSRPLCHQSCAAHSVPYYHHLLTCVSWRGWWGEEAFSLCLTQSVSEPPWISVT